MRAGRTSDLACRVYATPEGLRGMPTSDQLVTALAARADVESHARGADTR